MSIDPTNLRNIISSLLFASNRGLSKTDMQNIIEQKSDFRPETEEITQALSQLEPLFKALAIELSHTGSGYRLQTQKEYAPWVSGLWQEKAPRYSKALLETLALIAYRQPITRGEVEHIRGVSVSSHIIRTLLERRWVRVIGHREVPGKPALYGTTKDFLDYFDLKSLSELPSLPELKSIEELDKTVQDLIEQSSPNTEANTESQEDTKSEAIDIEEPDAPNDKLLH